MKRIIIKLFSFFVLITASFYIYVVIIDKIADKKYGINTSDQIKQSFQNALKRDYNVLILGNSEPYRDINPDRMIGSKAYNFAHDNDAYNQAYYKLLYLDSHNINIDTLILCTDYTAFSYISNTRNYIYDKYFDQNYYKDYNSLYLIECFKNLKEYYLIKHNLSYELIDWLLNNNQTVTNYRYQRENGQLIVEGNASPNDSIDREELFLDFQFGYFKKIVEFCKSKNIMLFVINMPTRDEELKCFSKSFMEMFDNKIKSVLITEKMRYVNYSTLLDFKDYRDYVDICHLNERAADRFSSFFWEDIRKQ